MKISMWRCLALIASGLCFGTLANAAERQPGWEVGTDIYYQFSDDETVDGGSSISFDDDLGIAITFGYRFSPLLELQFGMDWNSVDYTGFISAAPPSVFSPRRFSGSMEAFTPRVGLNLNLMRGPFAPYVTGGIGWSFIDTNIPDGRPSNVCYWDPWYGYICGTVQNTRTMDELSYYAGAGIRFDFGYAYTMRLSYEKKWLELENITPAFDQVKLGIVYRY
jgi:opacity protein-like surface antigen